MRGRPKLLLYFLPNPPQPGAPLQVELRMQSKSDTPIDGIALTLRGIERRLNGMVMAGNVPVANYHTHTHVALTAKRGPQVLTKGEHTVHVRFDLPPGIPPAFASRYTTIEYELDVHVSIPWWPDRRERYLVNVGAIPRPMEAARPVTFCNTEGGARGRDLYIETSVDRARIELGDVLTGALSIANVAYHRIRRVELAFVSTESAAASTRVGHREEVSRYVFAVVPDGSTLVDGAPIPFRLRFPEKGVPTFDAAFIKHTWQLEVRAVISLGTDVTMYVPIVVSAPSGEVMIESSPVPRVAPVGKERRALVWGEVARRAGLHNDAERERMTVEVGDVSLGITLEHRGEAGMWSVATLRWPSLGLDARVSERRWVDAFKGEVAIDDPELHERFTVRAREAPQITALLTKEVRDVLGSFENVALDDEGAVFASRGGAFAVDELLPFVSRAREAATTLNTALVHIPFPALFAEKASEWATLADRLGGRLMPGRPIVIEGMWDREPVEVGIRWSQNLARTLLRVRFPRTVELAAQTEDTHAIVRSFTAEHAEVQIARDFVEVLHAKVIDDESVILGDLDRLVVLARLLRGERDGGPYR